MPVFPPAPAIRVSIDGRTVAQYARPFVWRGRIYVAGALLRLLADRVWRDREGVVVVRDDRRIRLRPAFGSAADFDVAAFAMAPALRALGDSVRYVAASSWLQIRTPHRAPLVTPTPFVMPAVTVPVRSIFTPEPLPTPRPVWTGSPVPRRTPLPFPPLSRLRR